MLQAPRLAGRQFECRRVAGRLCGFVGSNSSFWASGRLLGKLERRGRTGNEWGGAVVSSEVGAACCYGLLFIACWRRRSSWVRGEYSKLIQVVRRRFDSCTDSMRRARRSLLFYIPRIL